VHPPLENPGGKVLLRSFEIWLGSTPPSRSALLAAIETLFPQSLAAPTVLWDDGDSESDLAQSWEKLRSLR
jgi:hypothetical protein